MKLGSKETPMFNMEKIGYNIAKFRKATGMTQMQLADELGISFQAVSNWERGQSCPDISKLAELSKLFGVSIDDILENKSVSKVVEQITEKKEMPKMDAKEIESFAPFMSEEQVKEAVEVKGGLQLSDIVRLAPFLSEEYLDTLATRVLSEDVELDSLAQLAPFLGEETLDALVLRLPDGDVRTSKLAVLAPFLSEEALGALVSRMDDDPKGHKMLLPFMDDDAVDELAEKVYASRGVGELAHYAPFMSEEKIAEIVSKEIKKGDLTSLMPLLPFVDSSLLEELIDNDKI